MYKFKFEQFSPQLDKNTPYVIKRGDNGRIGFYIDLTPSNSFHFDEIPNPIPEITLVYYFFYFINVFILIFIRILI